MKIKTSELIGSALDWAVAVCEGRKEPELMDNFAVAWFSWGNSHYSTNWAMGGPIIESEGIELLCNLTATEAERFSNSRADWQAFYRNRRSTEERSYATTPLIAAMRCYVASKMGDEIEIPEELV